MRQERVIVLTVFLCALAICGNASHAGESSLAGKLRAILGRKTTRAVRGRVGAPRSGDSNPVDPSVWNTPPPLLQAGADGDFAGDGLVHAVVVQGSSARTIDLEGAPYPLGGPWTIEQIEHIAEEN